MGDPMMPGEYQSRVTDGIRAMLGSVEANPASANGGNTHRSLFLFEQLCRVADII